MLRARRLLLTVVNVGALAACSPPEAKGPPAPAQTPDTDDLREVTVAAIESAADMPELYELVACTRVKRLVAPALGESRAQRPLMLSVAMTTERIAVPITSKPGSRAATTVAATKVQGDRRYRVAFAAADCGALELRVEQAAGHGWQVDRAARVFRSDADQIAFSALQLASRTRAIHELVACSKEASMLVRVAAPDGSTRILDDVAGQSVWRLRGPVDSSLRLLTAPSPAVTTLDIEQRGAAEYAVAFASAGCGRYEMSVTQTPLSSAEDRHWRVEWKGADPLGQMPGQCSRDAECPADEICTLTWQQWSEGRRAWAGSGGRCEAGTRCDRDQDCRGGHRCDIYERIYAHDGALQRATCKAAGFEPSDCTSLSVKCNPKQVAWVD